MVSNPKDLGEGDAPGKVRVQARPALAEKPRPRVQAVPAPAPVPAPGGVNLGQAPVRIPEGGINGASVIARSVFDESVRGLGSPLQQVRVRMTPSPLQAVAIGEHATPVAAARPVVTARASMGQEEVAVPLPERIGVERVIQRELSPVGLTRDEAASISAALGPALEASAKALQEGVKCGRVDSVTIQEVRLLREFLARFALVASADERTDRLSSDDFSMIDEVLACQAIAEQVAGAREDKTTALLVGGLVVGAIVLVIAS